MITQPPGTTDRTGWSGEWEIAGSGGMSRRADTATGAEHPAAGGPSAPAFTVRGVMTFPAGPRIAAHGQGYP
jgi:hypothetical protein